MHSHQYRKHLIERHIIPHQVTSPHIHAVFTKVAREKFLPHLPLGMVYSDAILKTSHNRFILPPQLLVKILHHLNPQPEDTAMVVAGSGGYTTALLSFLCSTVFLLDTVDISLQPLYEIYEELNISNVVPMQGELKEGLPRQGPFDLIFFDVGISSLAPSFVNQLKEGGKLICCTLISPYLGEITCFSRQEGEIHKTILFEGFIPSDAGLSTSGEFEF